MIRKLPMVILLSTIFYFAACGSGGEDDNSNDNGNSNGNQTSLTSQCGVVVGGAVDNPATTGERVTVDAVSSDTVIVTRLEGEQTGNRQIIKLHGVTATGVARRLIEQGISLIENRASSAYLVIADPTCNVAVTGGGVGTFGQLFTTSGNNINESLLGIGAVVPSADACNGNLLVGCYQGIPVEEQVSDTTLGKILWKPVSDSSGNLAVLTDAYDVTIVVRGAITETLRSVGPSNGYGTTARGNRPGCSFGSNVRVELFDERGYRVLTNSGLDTVTIPNGCARTTLFF